MNDVLTPAELEALLNPPSESENDDAEFTSTGVRRFNRFERHLPVELVVNDRATRGELDDIGIGGARLHLDGVPPPLPAEVHVRVAAADLHVDVPARVLWARPRRHGVELGVRFEALTPAELTDLAAFIQRTEPEERHPASTTPPQAFPAEDVGRRGA